MKWSYRVLVCALGLSGAVAYGQERLDNDSLLNILLGAYSGASQAYSKETGEKLPEIKREDLKELERNLTQLETLVTNDDGEVDINKVNTLLKLASESDAEFLGFKLNSLQQPLQLLQYAQTQSLTWQQALESIQAQNKPIIADAIGKLGGSVEQSNELSEMADVLSVIVGAGMALDKLSQEDGADALVQAGEALGTEVDFFKQLAQAQLPALTTQTTAHQVSAMVASLKVAYAESVEGEHRRSTQQENVKALRHLMDEAQGQLSADEYRQIERWLERLGAPYRSIKDEWQAQQEQLLR